MLKRLFIIVVLVTILALSCIYLPTDSNTLTQSPIQVGINAQGEINQPNSQLYFSRKGQDPASVLSALYLSATDNLDIAIYSLTHPQIVKAIGDAFKRGVKVRVITDRTQAAGATQKHAMNDLITIGVPIKIDSHSGLMHLKMSVIDGKVATTGSYNYSRGASEDNDEMLVVINEPWFAKLCQDEFDRLWNSPQFTELKMSY